MVGARVGNCVVPYAPLGTVVAVAKAAGPIGPRASDVATHYMDALTEAVWRETDGTEWMGDRVAFCGHTQEFGSYGMFAFKDGRPDRDI